MRWQPALRMCRTWRDKLTYFYMNLWIQFHWNPPSSLRPHSFPYKSHNVPIEFHLQLPLSLFGLAVISCAAKTTQPTSGSATTSSLSPPPLQSTADTYWAGKPAWWKGYENVTEIRFWQFPNKLHRQQGKLAKNCLLSTGFHGVSSKLKYSNKNIL